MVQVEDEHGEGAAAIAARALRGVTQPLHETDAVRQSGERIVQRVVAELSFDALGFRRATPQLDLCDGGLRDLAEVSRVLLTPVPSGVVKGEDDRQRLAGAA